MATVSGAAIEAQSLLSTAPQRHGSKSPELCTVVDLFGSIRSGARPAMSIQPTPKNPSEGSQTDAAPRVCIAVEGETPHDLDHGRPMGRALFNSGYPALGIVGIRSGVTRPIHYSVTTSSDNPLSAPFCGHE